MNVAILRKTLAESAGLCLAVVLGIVAFEVFLVAAAREFTDELSHIWFSNTFIRRLLHAMVGADIGTELTPALLLSVGFVHPFVYALTWTLIVTFCTRGLVGEIDRGTADLLLTLPVSRMAVYVSVSVVWLGMGVVASAAPLIGVWLGVTCFPFWEPVQIGRFWIASVNLFALYLAIGGLTLMVSAWSSRRGVAVGMALGYLFFSVMAHFLGAFWRPAEVMSVVGVLEYYRPLAAVRTGAWPVTDLCVLIGVGLAAWGAGLIRYRRRDIPAV
jgi:ABC-2 type transport system permease protein